MTTQTTVQISKKLRRDVTLKDGRHFSEGERFAIAFSPPDGPVFFTATRESDGASYVGRNFGAFFPKPDTEELEEMVNDGICETVTGERTEPDGYGCDGSPSWLLALGMI